MCASKLTDKQIKEQSLIVQKLIANGWNDNISKQFNFVKNIINSDAESYLSYENNLNTLLNLQYFAKAQSIIFTIYDKKVDDLRCLQIAYENNLEPLLDKIISFQDEISLENQFMYYMEISSICSVSVICWEQFQ